MTPTPNPNSTIAIVAGFILSVAIVVVKFLDPSFITDALAGLIITIINLASVTFHITMVSEMSQTITTLSTKLSNAGIQH